MDAALDLGTLLAEAFTRHGAGDLDGATALYRQVLSANPRDALAHKGLGVALCQTGALGRGSKLLRRACELDPDDAESWTNLANACLASRDLKGCEEAARRAVDLDPQSAVAHNNLSVALRGRHHLDGAFRHASEAVRLAPGYALAHLNQAVALQGVGAMGEAGAAFREAVRLEPRETALSQSYLFALLYDEGLSPEEVVAAHRHWGSTFPAPPRPPMRGTPETVGFVSGDFRGHPVGRFVLPFITEFCRERRVVLYSNNPSDDSMTERFRSLPVEWRSVVGLGAAEVADQVRRDGVDYLVDLSGHTASNRLDAFALRPAPVQATWLGYSSTTGLPAMDWFIGDHFVFPEGLERLATESLARLDTAFLVDGPLAALPARAGQSGLRIGVTNNPAKLSDSFLNAVGRVLASARDAKVCFKYGTSDSELFRARVRGVMGAAGVDMSRVEFVGALPQDEHEAFLSGLDLCLDSFPYNGATTTMDALRAGTPVLTMAGRSYASRMTGSLLHHAGLGGLVTGSADEYVAKAVDLARSPAGLESARATLRDELAGSVLFDARRFADAFGDVVAATWSATRP